MQFFLYQSNEIICSILVWVDFSEYDRSLQLIGFLILLQTSPKSHCSFKHTRIWKIFWLCWVLSNVILFVPQEKLWMQTVLLSCEFFLFSSDRYNTSYRNPILQKGYYKYEPYNNHHRYLEQHITQENNMNTWCDKTLWSDASIQLDKIGKLN